LITLTNGSPEEMAAKKHTGEYLKANHDAIFGLKSLFPIGDARNVPQEREVERGYPAEKRADQQTRQVGKSRDYAVVTTRNSRRGSIWSSRVPQRWLGRKAHRLQGEKLEAGVRKVSFHLKTGAAGVSMVSGPPVT